MPAELIAASDEAIGRAARLIRAGELVAFPTETVYGLGGDATNETAVARIFAAKGRPHFNPLIVHVPELAEAERLAVFDERARIAARRFWPGPLSLVLPRRADSGLSLLASAGLDTRRIARPGACRSAGAAARRRTADRRALGQPLRPDQPDHRRARRRRVLYGTGSPSSPHRRRDGSPSPAMRARARTVRPLKPSPALRERVAEGAARGRVRV